MEIAEALEFLRVNPRGVIATTRADGGTQMSPVVVGVDGDDRVLVSTRATALKTAHVRRSGRAAFLALSETFFGPWVQVEGPVEVISLPEAMDGLVDYYRLVSGEHPDWDDYRAAMVRDGRVLLRMTVERAGPSRSG
jgi:PPOX class probable F420-dependent enzyme